MQQGRRLFAPPRRQSGSSAFTLTELLVVIVVVMVLAAILFSMGFHGHSPLKARQSSCASNEKQITLALLGYLQDYDEKLPPAVSYWRSEATGLLYPRPWGAEQISPGLRGESVLVPGIIADYVRNTSIFRCPEAARTNKAVRFTYMLNDLATTAATSDFTAPARSILVAEGENRLYNAGHAWEPDHPSQPAVFNKQGGCDPNSGATLHDAPIRHADGANYAFADGHVKWIKSAQVFFPPRASAARSHKDSKGNATGPDPKGDLVYKGWEFRATFHLR